MDAAVPVIVVSDHGDPARTGGPDREGDAADAVHLTQMGAKAMMDAVVVALADQVEVLLGDRGQETVRVLDLMADSLGIKRPERIGEGRRQGQGDLEDVGVQEAVHPDRRLSRANQLTAGGSGKQGPDH
jgi:hypothetical protein